MINGSKTYINKELEQILSDEFLLFETNVLKYSVTDLVNKLSKNNIRTSSFKVSEILKNQYQLEAKNSSYIKYNTYTSADNKLIIEETVFKGRHYTFTKEEFGIIS